MVVETVEKAVVLCVDLPAVEGEKGVLGGELGGRGDVADAVAVGAGEEVDVGLGDFDRAPVERKMPSLEKSGMRKGWWTKRRMPDDLV